MPPRLFLFDDAPPPMLVSDSASSSSSSSPSSPPPLRHRLKRRPSSSSSSRHCHFHLSSRPYSPSSREADIARLLDPAYASPVPISPLTKSPRMAVKEVYVDHHGDLHDPDFRDFPPFGHSRQPPRWERTYADDEDDEDDERCPIERQRSSFDLQRRPPSSTLAYNPAPTFYPYEEHASYESRYLEDEEEEEEDLFERAPLKEKSFYRRSRSPTKRPKSQEELQAPPTTEGDEVIQADSDWTPTCTENLRRHWQAISLSFRFSIFRTKRRLRRRLTG